MILDRVTQTVTIGGSELLVSGCQVSRSASERVGTIDFIVERDVVGSSLYASVIVGAVFNHTHAAEDGPTITETAEAFEVSEVDLAGARIKRVRCRTQEAVMRDVRVLKVWENRLASEVAAEIAALHPNISEGSIAETGRKVSRVASRYDSLYDCLEQLRQQTGLSWRVSNNQLNVFDPNSVTGPQITKIQTMRGTLNVTTNNEMLANVARMQAYESVDINLCEAACTTFKRLTVTGSGWEVFGEVEKSPLSFPDNFSINPEAKTITWDRSPYPFYARFKLRRIVWVQVDNAESIAVYGRREAAPLYHDGGVSIDAAYGILTESLKRTAWPTIEIKGVQPTVFGHDADSRVLVTYPSRGIERYFMVDRVTRTTTKTELTVSLDLKAVDDD
jgi:hypothetical protein